MWKNYLLVAIRNAKRNKVFTFINIMGLALGMACSLLILLWIRDERSIDNFHVNNARLFGVYERQYYDNKVNTGFSTPGLTAEEMKKVFPEIEYSSGFAWNDLATFQVNDKIIKEDGNHASGDFFKMFSYKLLQGNAKTALSTVASIAISHKMANDFFGSPAQAIGKSVRFQNAKDYQVTAVFENLPANSSIKFDYLLNWESFLEENDWAKNWGNNGPRTFIMLRADANPVAFEKKIIRFLNNYNKEQNAAFRIELGIQHFGAMYLHSQFKEGRIEGGRIEYVRLFSIIAAFILLIACINFMNLTTARSVKRAKEIGIRKVAGALRSSLIRQFIGEAISVALISATLALLLVALLLPAFNHLTRKEIILPLSDRSAWLSMLGLTLLTGIVSGSYPALLLSSFKPVKILKGTLKYGTQTAFFRKGLVVFQFVLSIVLIIGTIIISQQVNYVRTTNLGYDRENLVYIPLEGDLTGKYTVFKEQASRLPGVKLITRMTQTPTEISNSTGGVEWEGKDPNVQPEFTQASVGYDFVKTLNLTVLQGRDFSKDFPTDSVAYILNEAALKKMSYKEPIGKPLTFWQHKGTILAIVKDFHFASLHQPIQPLILRLKEDEGWGSALVRTEPGKTKEALAGLASLCKQLNPKFPFTYSFSDEEYQKLYTSEQVVNKLSDYFAFLAIFISCLGLLGLAIFTAEQRIKEIGIRKVLGAGMGSLFFLLSKEFLVLILIAFLIATPLGWWAMHAWLQNFAYQINIGWWIFLLAGLLAIVIALLTVSFQAIKAAVANPVKSLRSE
jgi:putative ABC transport system permease protein